jgi:hypothetical protein
LRLVQVLRLTLFFAVLNNSIKIFLHKFLKLQVVFSGPDLVGLLSYLLLLLEQIRVLELFRLVVGCLLQHLELRLDYLVAGFFQMHYLKQFRSFRQLLSRDEAVAYH